MKQQIITITGKPGSGKTTTANLLAEQLKYDRYSAGSFLRQIALDRGITNEEANRRALTDPTIDKAMDALVVKVGETRDRMIIDGRLTFHFIPGSFKVYLDLDLPTAAERIFKAGDEARRASGDVLESAEATLATLESRLSAEQARYMKAYGIDPHDTSQFDLVINTAHTGPEEVTTRIIEAYKKWLDT